MFGKDMVLKERIFFIIVVWVFFEWDFVFKWCLWVLMIRKVKLYLGGCIDWWYDVFDEMKVVLEGVKIYGYKLWQDSLVVFFYVYVCSFEV